MISLPGIVGGTSLVLILICAALLLLAVMTILYKNKKANKPAPISVGKLEHMPVYMWQHMTLP